MISAVELQPGPGIGIYSHHPPFGRSALSVSSSHLHQIPLSSTATVHQQQLSMSGEFARPKPKSIGSLSLSSPPSPAQKYSHHEQNGPVNLAVNSSSPNVSHGSSPSKNEPLDQKEIDVVGLGSSNSNSVGPQMSHTTATSRISSYPTGLGANAYQALNYSFYGSRYGTPMFPHRSAYPQHHSSRPTYLPPQLDSYPSYLSAAASYTSNTVGGYSTVASPQLPSSSGDMSSNAHKASSERSHSMSSLNNGHHPYATKEKETKNSPRFEDARNNNFKVPSGKEGSLKHRILTTSRPQSDKYGVINHPANRSPLGNNSLLNFQRGSLIELSNGSLRRVEDLRTEDFVMSAEKSQDLQLADSTVVKILSTNNNSNFVMITFSYDNNRSKVDIEAKFEHPFFVYGQGWASCNPEGSMSAFGLKCQRLQVGDVCISLKPREIKLEAPSSPMQQKRTALQPQHSQQQQQQLQREMYHHHVKEQQLQDSTPQNLSRRSSTTSSNENAAMAQYSPALYSLQMSLFAAASQGRIPASYAPFLNEESNAHITHDLNTSLNINNSSDKLPISMSKNSNTSSQEDYADDLQSRKRRWSAPDNEEEQQQQQQQQQQQHQQHLHQQSRKAAN